MGESDPLFVGLAVVGFGIFFFYMGFRWHYRYNLIRNTPTSKCRSIAMGLVEVFGKAMRFDRVLTSPFTAAKCYYFRYTIEEYRKQGKHSSWVTIRSGHDSAPFYLQDETGKVLVSPANAEIEIPHSYQMRSGIGRGPPDVVQKFLSSEGVKSTSLFGFNRSLRFTEYVIPDKKELYILGYAGNNPYLKEGTAQKNEEAIMIQKGDHREPYMISDKSEDKLLSGLKWMRIGGLLGGIVLIAGGLLILFAYFRIL